MATPKKLSIYYQVPCVYVLICFLFMQLKPDCGLSLESNQYFKFQMENKRKSKTDFKTGSF
jgi:hypothetical protein